MQKILKRYLFACLFLWRPLVSTAADGNINFTNITVKEGLPSNAVSAIIKDKFGLMWFGTSNGLCKFDGTNFVIYRHVPGKANTLPGNEVLCLYEDGSGRIWIGTGAGGLSYYDRMKDEIIPYKGNGTWPELPHVSPRAIMQDHLGNLWVGTYGDLRTIDLRSGKITAVHLSGSVKDDEKTKDGNTFVALSLLEDNKSRIWIGTNRGLYRYDLRVGKMTRFINDPHIQGSLSDNVVKSLLKDRNGDIWAATFGGLNRLLPDDRFEIFRHKTDAPGSLSSDALFAIQMDADGKLWIGTENGIDIMDLPSKSFRILQPDPRNVFSLKDRSIRSIFIDPKGIYWIGTFGGGLAKYDKNLPLFNLKHSDPFDRSGLGSSFVDAFAEYDKNSIFVATDGGGIQLFNRQSGLFTNLAIKSRLRSPRSGLTVWPLYMDHARALWAGTYHDGLFRIDPRSGNYEQFVADKVPGALNSNDITSIMEDEHAKIWIGTLGGGVSIYDPLSHRFTPFAQEFRQRLPLNDFISCIAKSPSGKIWIASSGTGMAVFDPATRRIKHYTKAQNKLPDDVVGNLFFDSDGVLWLSTQSGMCCLDEKTQRVTTYTEKDGLADGMVKSIVEDKSGLLWISTAHGISSFDKHTGRFQNFDSENGAQQGDFITGASLRRSNGEIYFGGRDGFNYFNPANVQHQSGSGPVLLTDLKVSNESVVPGEDAPIKEQIAVAKEINLKYGLNFSVSYVAVNFTTPFQNQYAYKLVGFDKDWNYVHKGKTANYTNIDPGTYTFEVKTSNDGEHWTTPATSIKIRVLPPFWRTGYAYALYIFMAGSILYLLRRRGIQKIRHEFEVQREKSEFRQLLERERREAEQLHELDLLKIKFLTDLSHEFRTPISLIMAPVDKLLRRRLADEELEDIRMINRNARRLLNMVNQLLDFRKMEEQELHLNLTLGEIISFIGEAGDSFRDVAGKKQISFTIKAHCPFWWANFDHNKLERIIFNLLSNAFKFTPAGGEVKLTMEMIEIPDADSHLIITVSDTGVGIPEKDLARIFDRFFQHQTDTILNQGTGIGLSITKEFIEMHGGNMRVESQVGVGTRFIVDLPLPTYNGDVSAHIPANDYLAGSAAVTTEQFMHAVREEDQLLLNGDQNETHKTNTTILLVEDNEEFRTYLARHLRKYYQIVEAADGKQGWQKTLNAHPQLVVSDINMPVMTGIELSKKIKEDKRTCHIPVILLTAMAGEDEQLKGLKSGASDYLSKPFNFQILNTRIGNLLNLNKNVKDTYSKQIQLEGNDIVTASGNLKLLNSILKYIEDKLSDPNMSVEDLSKHVGMSRGSLYYKLIELTGLSPIEYIRTVKLEKAATLMERSELNVTQIAYMTGFGTPSYFTRMFKNKYGIVPSEYLNAKRTPPKPVIYPAV
ncbi:response regulator [Mucilaginibacter sp. BJC16-A38]|uniref:hybrid sensor histidine kinase/response regulator transcription factor n=1 Tax=Mucilaginibacter phenanthrenivorans TaxID=1234842 RepID=UPI00215710E7|nr:hybrid sensor histidine kinase/response regulator transcription factor [Mucilaginibacter phenanthrenivorans]MCR8556510.1 response regulator [Mucilaginibacter phenanthrenivorans]